MVRKTLLSDLNYPAEKTFLQQMLILRKAYVSSFLAWDCFLFQTTCSCCLNEWIKFCSYFERQGPGEELLLNVEIWTPLYQACHLACFEIIRQVCDQMQSSFDRFFKEKTASWTSWRRNKKPRKRSTRAVSNATGLTSRNIVKENMEKMQTRGNRKHFAEKGKLKEFAICFSICLNLMTDKEGLVIRKITVFTEPLLLYTHVHDRVTFPHQIVMYLFDPFSFLICRQLGSDIIWWWQIGVWKQTW